MFKFIIICLFFTNSLIYAQNHLNDDNKVLLDKISGTWTIVRMSNPDETFGIPIKIIFSKDKNNRYYFALKTDSDNMLLDSHTMNNNISLNNNNKLTYISDAVLAGIRNVSYDNFKNIMKNYYSKKILKIDYSENTPNLLTLHVSNSLYDLSRDEKK